MSGCRELGQIGKQVGFGAAGRSMQVMGHAFAPEGQIFLLSVSSGVSCIFL